MDNLEKPIDVTGSSNNTFETTDTEQGIHEKHLSRGKRLLKMLFSPKSAAENNEVAPLGENYLLSEHLAPSETPFGTPRSNSKKDRRFASKWLKDVCEGWDNCGVDIPRELGEQIENMVKDPNHFFGVHRSYGINGEECDTDEVLHSILTEGLTNLGDASSGAIYKDPDVSKTVSPCTNMLNTVINLKTSYKGSSGAVLVQIPIEYCNKEGKVKPGMENQVYDHNELGNSRIKPEFLVGFVTKPTQGKCEFKSREELLSSYENSRH